MCATPASRKWPRRRPAIAAKPSQVPPHVTELGPQRLTFAGPCGELRRWLSDQGLGERLFRNEALQLCLAWDIGGGIIFEDEPTHGLLTELVYREVAFLERYNDPEGPAELMRALCADGTVPPFQSLLVRGPDDWELIDNP